MNPRHLVVVGASLAGLRAVEAARKAGFEGEITLVGAEPHLPYDRPPLSKAYLEEIATGEEPVPTTFRDEAYFSEELATRLVLGTAASALHTEQKVVTVGHREISYDALVIATGADARRLPGTEGLRGVHSLRTLDDAVTIRAALDARARIVVIGAGFIGAELAATASKRGLAPVVIEATATPLVRAVGEEMGARLAFLHYRNGTDLRCGVGVRVIEGNGHVERVILEDGTVLPADLVVVGVGTIPTTGWLEGSGLTIDNGVVCDENLYTGVDGVYAAGDIARWQNPVFDRLMRLEHWTSAAEQGAAAARNAIDPDNATAYSTVPYFWSDQYEVRIQFVGSPESDEIVVVDGDLDVDNRLIALYRKGGHLVGALTVQGQTEIMKYRGMIARRTPWQEAIKFAETRKTAREARLVQDVRP